MRKFPDNLFFWLEYAKATYYNSLKSFVHISVLLSCKSTDSSREFFTIYYYILVFQHYFSVIVWLTPWSQGGQKTLEGF